MLDTSKIKTSWNFSLIVPDESDATIEIDLKKSEELIQSFVDKWQNDPRFLSDPLVLKSALDDFEHLLARGVSGNAGYYINLKSSLFQDDPVVKARENKIDDRLLVQATKLDFFTLGLSRIAPEVQEKFLSDPGLSDYKQFLLSLFEIGKFLLSEKEERVVALMSTTAYSNWVKMTSEFITTEERDVLDEDGKIHTKNFSDILSMLDSSNKAVRDSAAAAINTIFDKYIKVGEAEMNSVLNYKKTSDFLRGYTRPDQSSYVADNIDSSVIDLLLDVVSSNNEIVHKYYELKAKLLGLPELQYYERNILYKGMDKQYSFDQAVQLVDKTMSKLDPEFAQIFAKFLEQGRIDAFTKKGKTNMEFCSVPAKSQPAYVLLNFTGKAVDVSTVAHEMGHAINDEMVKCQNSLNIGIPLCLAETASTFFEDFTLDEIANTMTDEEKLALKIFRLDNAMNAVFRQIACYKFELDLHNQFREKGFLSKEDMAKIFGKNMSAYSGPAVVMTEATQNWWLHWPHIRSYFYVYSYAFGHLVSKYMQDMVRKDSTNIEKVKTFLKVGSSKSPKEILAAIDIDINDRAFWQNGLDQVSVMLDETEQFARKLGKI